jgi:hypothetical protein
MLIVGNVERIFRLVVIGHTLDVVIYLHNKDQQDALFSFLIYSNNHPLHVSNRLTIHRQEVFYCIYSIW